MHDKRQRAKSSDTIPVWQGRHHREHNDVLDVQPTPPTEAFIISKPSTSPLLRQRMTARAQEEAPRQSILLRAQPLMLLRKPSSARTLAEMRETAELVLHHGQQMASNAAVMQQSRVPPLPSSPPLTRPPPAKVFGDGLDGAGEHMQNTSPPLVRPTQPTIGMNPMVRPLSSSRRQSTPLTVSDAFAPPPAPLPSISPTSPSRFARPLVQLPPQPPTPPPERSTRGWSSSVAISRDACAEEDATSRDTRSGSTHTAGHMGDVQAVSSHVCTPLAALETSDPLAALERALEAGNLTAESVFGAILRVRQLVSIPRAVGPCGSTPCLRVTIANPPLCIVSLLRRTSTSPTRASRQRLRRWTRQATARSAPRRCARTLPRCTARVSTRRHLPP